MLLFISCEKQQQVEIQSKEITYETFTNFVSSKFSNETALNDILLFINLEKNKKINNNVSRSKIVKIESYMEEKGLSVGDGDEIYNFLIENPEEINNYIKITSSQHFYNLYSKIYFVKDKEMYFNEIMNDSLLSNKEKAMLSLFIVESKQNTKKSLWSCVKRYAKLAEITGGTLYLTLLESDPASATSYAENALKNMGPEYDC